MKKYLFLLLPLLATSAYALAPMVKDGGGNYVQGAAYNGKKALAVTSATTIDMRGDLAYAWYCAADAFERWMPAADTDKSAYVQTTVLGGAWQGGIVNPATPFVNISGCSGYVKRQ